MPVTAATREYVITYNSVAVSPHGYPSFSIGKDRATLTFDVIIKATTQSAFASACTTFETAYRTPYQSLTVTLSGNSLLSASQSGNTALDPIASVEVLGGPPDTGLSRAYRVRIEYGVPASLGGGGGGTTGLRDATTTLSYTPAGRASVTMRGTFTAVGSSDAKAVYDAAIGAYATALMSYFGISPYQLVGRPSEDISINKKTLDFVRVYEEIFAPQAAPANLVVRQIVNVTRARRGSDYISQTRGAQGGTIGGSSTSHNTGNVGDGPGDYAPPPSAPSAGIVTPLADVTATYEAWIDKAQSTNLPSTWDTIRSFVLAQIADLVGTSSFGLLSDAPSYNKDDNKITAVVSGVIADTDGVALIQNVFEQSIQVQPGYDFIPVWNGDPLAAIVYQGQEVTTRTTTRRWREIGAAQSGDSQITGWSPGAAGSGGAGVRTSVANVAAGAAGTPSWYPVSNIGTPDNPMSRTVGIGRAPFVIPVTEKWYVTVERAATAI